MTKAVIPHLMAQGLELNAGPDSFGYLRASNDILEDAPALRSRMAEDGYLYLPGFLDRDEVLTVRRGVCERLQDMGILDPATDPMEGIVAPGQESSFKPDVAQSNTSLETLLYGADVMDFYAHFLGGPVLHFDFTWFRAFSPGKGTVPHCDSVYMNRGTFDLYTAWVPFGDVSLELGGLMILENSSAHRDQLRKYLEMDVDSYCENRPDAEAYKTGKKHRPGYLSTNPVSLQEKLGGRWLTAEFRAGDFLTFGMATIHASLDNQTPDRIRLSSDSRYQLASEPADERWIGHNPVGHSAAGKRGRIC